MDDVTRKLLVLDLDETLLYATRQPLERIPDFKVASYSVYKRPFVAEFLAYCFTRFDVAVWTSASTGYAAAIVKTIFPADCPLVFCWSATRCSYGYDPETGVQYVRKPFGKMYRRFRHYGRRNIIAIDDTPQKWEQSYGNLVRVTEWLGDENDDELRLLIRYLEVLRAHPNVRKVEKRSWRSCVEVISSPQECSPTAWLLPVDK